MANFLLQNDKDTLEIEEIIVEDVLKRNRHLHGYEKASIRDIDSIPNKEFIPVGTIDFVTKYLSKFGYCDIETPIEIPKYLQTEEFLKRKYDIVTWDKIPRIGKFFLKDVSELKKFSGVIDTTYDNIDEMFNYKSINSFDTSLVLNKNHMFQVSSILNIKTEYRVYVIGNEIEAISSYEGSPINLPDTGLLQKAISLIQLNEEYLQSYTIDIAVGDFGTAILEIHNFTSVGLYNALWGNDLLYAYVDGINYIKNDNSIKYM